MTQAGQSTVAGPGPDLAAEAAAGQRRNERLLPMAMEPLGEKKQRMARLRAVLRGRDKESLRNIGLLIFTVVSVSVGFWLTANIIGLDESGILARTFKSFSGSPWAVLVVSLGFTAASLIGAPQFLLIAITVAAFGPLYGFLFATAATLCSASVNFFMARYLGADWLRRRGWQGIGSLSEMVGRNGFMSALVVRIIPSAPFIVVNMALGLTRMSFPAFLGGTAVGILPKTALIALLGKVVERATAGDPKAIAYLTAATLAWIGLAFLAKWIVRRRETRRAKNAVRSAERPDSSASDLSH